MEKKKYVTYLRVSTQKQGATGLGLDAQRKMCADFIAHNNGEMVAEFTDVESGTHRDRKGLWAAIEYCSKNDIPLVIAKLDRLARDVEFTFKVINTGIDIHFCDMPQVNTMILGVFASVAQYERELCSDRTKKALDEKKRQGCKLGGATEKWQATFDAKSEKQKKEEFAKRGGTKSAHFIDSRDTQAMFRIIKNVYPKAVHDKKGNEIDNPAEWNWLLIKTKVEARESIRRYMKDYKAMDESGKLFAKWNLENMDDKAFQLKLAALFLSYKRSLLKK